MPDPRFGRTTRIRVIGGEILASIPSDGSIPWVDENLSRQVNLREVLEGIKRRALDLRTPFNAFREVWFGITRDVFESEGAAGGQAWAGLDPAYAAWKEKHYPGQPLLKLTNRMFDSLTGGAGLIYEAGPRSLRYGSRLPYFEFHMTGTPDHGMPARPPIALPRWAFAELNRMVMGFIQTGVSR